MDDMMEDGNSDLRDDPREARQGARAEEKDISTHSSQFLKSLSFEYPGLSWRSKRGSLSNEQGKDNSSVLFVPLINEPHIRNSKLIRREFSLHSSDWTRCGGVGKEEESECAKTFTFYYKHHST